MKNEPKSVKETDNDTWVVEIRLCRSDYSEVYKTELFMGNEDGALKFYKQLKPLKGSKLVVVIP